jgi:hypothetical protein
VCDTAGGDWVDGRVDDDGVKDGLRPLEEPEDSVWPEAADDEDERSLTPVPAAALSLAWPGAFESLLDERANQLFVAAIACLTAWRPVSSTPLPEPALSARRVSSGFSGDVASAAAEPAPVRDEPAPVRDEPVPVRGEAAPVRAEPAPAPVEPEPAPAAARKPAAGVFEPFGFPISSAGNGTGAWLDLPAPARAPEPGLSAPPDPDASAEREAEREAEEEEEEEEEEEGEDEAASSGAESAPF